MAHTPGPWILGSHGWMTEGATGSPDRWHGRFRRVIGDDGVVARVYCGTDDTDDTESRHPNVLLIASAPELLAALKQAVSLLSYASQDGGIYGCNADEWFGMEKSCRAAIAKAEGRADEN